MDLWRHHRIIGNVVVSLLVGTFLILLLTSLARTGELVSAIRETQKTNTANNANTTQTLDIIRSCTTPGQPCYEQSQRKTGELVGQIDSYVVLASSCTAALTLHGLPPDIAKDQLTRLITACVMRQLAHR